MTVQLTDAQGQPEVAQPYGRFAAAYAAGAERQFSEAMARFALRQANAGPHPCTSVLDVACGIGAACEYYAAEGLRTIGVDASADMLRQARTSAHTQGLPIEYIEQDMRHIAVSEAADLVTCMYDSLNFMLTSEDLINAFRSARGALRINGHYVFDMYTVRGLSEKWGSLDQVHTVHPCHFVATRTCWDPKLSMNTKTLWGFDKVGQQWRQWEERHTVRAYPLHELVEALMSAGFRVEGVFDWDHAVVGPATAATMRVVVVAEAS